MALFKPVVTSADLPLEGTSRESGTYDFKRTVDPAKKRELAKDVAAFANAMGGVVLVGADEDRDTGTLREYAPMPEAFAESVKAAYDRAITEFCRPQPIIDAVRVKAPPPASGYVVAINVNPTPPHFGK
ncbi:MAG TPA: ATP-binding protein [Polyangia bacterium]